jgi:Putative addiction module component
MSPGNLAKLAALAPQGGALGPAAVAAVKAGLTTNDVSAIAATAVLVLEAQAQNAGAMQPMEVLMVGSWLKQAGLKSKGCCHVQRHSCATHMLENGANIRFLHTSDPEIETAWKTEVDRRIEEIQSGKVQGISGEEVSARIRKIVGR